MNNYIHIKPERSREVILDTKEKLLGTSIFPGEFCLLESNASHLREASLMWEGHWLINKETAWPHRLEHMWVE